MTILNINKIENVPDEIQTAFWADCRKDDTIEVHSGVRPIQMCNSDGTGSPLLTYKGFGADVIRFDAGKGVMNHIHVGDHILFVIKGRGLVEYNGVDHSLYPGICYLVPGHVDHTIKAETELILIAVGNNHQKLDSKDRMTPLYGCK